MGILIFVLLAFALISYFILEEYNKRSEIKYKSHNNKLKLKTHLDKLDELLQGKDFEKANLKTYYLLKMISKVQNKDWISPEDIKNCDRDYLKTIDELWVLHSEGRFGFSIQKKIWTNLNGKLKYYEEANGYISNEFTDLVGWTFNGVVVLLNDFTFSTDAPIGHLPVIVKPGRINTVTNIDTPYEPKSGNWSAHIQEIFELI